MQHHKYLRSCTFCFDQVPTEDGLDVDKLAHIRDSPRIVWMLTNSHIFETAIKVEEVSPPASKVESRVTLILCMTILCYILCHVSWILILKTSFNTTFNVANVLIMLDPFWVRTLYISSGLCVCLLVVATPVKDFMAHAHQEKLGHCLIQQG